MRPSPEFLRTSAFRWTLASAALFACATAFILAFVYLQTNYDLTRQFDSLLVSNAALMTAPPIAALPNRLKQNLEDDPRQVKSAEVFDAGGRRLVGNIAALPAPLPPGQPQTTRITRISAQGAARDEIARVITVPLPDGGLLVLAHDMDQVTNLTTLFARALALGAGPALLLALIAGAMISIRTVRRIDRIAALSQKIMLGQLDQRLPTTGAHDDFGRFSRILNEMLDEIERLMTEAKGAGDAIAHDLRTPLTRLRSRLERARDAPGKSADDLRDAIDCAIQDVDGVHAMIDALLRIAEVEHGRRRAGFALLDISTTAREVAELFAPVAEDKGCRLVVRADEHYVVNGDRDLLFESISNLVDNAIKFTKQGGTVTLDVTRTPSGPCVVVTDEGPGIAPAERSKVTRRFYRGDHCRKSRGVGLGLSLVAAVARLHGFRLLIGEREGGRGSRVVLECWPDRNEALAA